MTFPTLVLHLLCIDDIFYISTVNLTRPQLTYVLLTQKIFSNKMTQPTTLIVFQGTETNV